MAADLGPADEAVASISGLASLLEESAEETIHLTKDGRVQRHGDQDVAGHGHEHVSNKGQPLGTREQSSFPSCKLFYQSVHKREERRCMGLADR